MTNVFPLTADDLRRSLEYRDGKLFWLARDASEFQTARSGKSWNAKYAGTEAGCVYGNGYRRILLNGTRISTHRAVWAMFTGSHPTIIDHVNGDRLDNRIENLRDTNAAGNCRNKRIGSNNTSGVVGVMWSKKAEKWKAYIKNDTGRNVHLGYFLDIEAASYARRAAAAAMGYSDNHGRQQ